MHERRKGVMGYLHRHHDGNRTEHRPVQRGLAQRCALNTAQRRDPGLSFHKKLNRRNYSAENPEQRREHGLAGVHRSVPEPADRFLNERAEHERS